MGPPWKEPLAPLLTNRLNFLITMHWYTLCTLHNTCNLYDQMHLLLDIILDKFGRNLKHAKKGRNKTENAFSLQTTRSTQESYVRNLMEPLGIYVLKRKKFLYPSFVFRPEFFSKWQLCFHCSTYIYNFHLMIVLRLQHHVGCLVSSVMAFLHIKEYKWTLKIKSNQPN